MGVGVRLGGGVGAGLLGVLGFVGGGGVVVRIICPPKKENPL